MNISECRQRARDYIDSLSIAKAPSWRLSTPQFDELKALSFSRLVEELDLEAHTKDIQRVFEDIIILRQYLATTLLQRNDEFTKNAVAVVRGLVLRVTLPTEAFAVRSPYATDGKPELTAYEITKYHAMSSDALAVLTYLEVSYPISGGDELETVAFLTCLSSFTDVSDPWTCESNWKTAVHLLETFRHFQDPKGVSNTLSVLLRERVKPAFTPTKNPAITPQARKAIDPLSEDASTPGELDDTTRPWKYRDVYIVTVLGWIIGSLTLVDVSFVEANWSLLVPPLLSLVDDSSLMYKAKGCAFVDTFLHNVPPHLLEQTGLGEVFENILMPCLMYLPSITGEEESLKLLGDAYHALISLAHARYPEHQDRVMRVKALDRIVRDGALKGYAQAGEHVKIADSLVKQMEKLVNEMGVDFVKHLKARIQFGQAQVCSG